MALSYDTTKVKIDYVTEDKTLYWATNGNREATLFCMAIDGAWNKRLAVIRYAVDQDQYAAVVINGLVRTQVEYYNSMEEAKTQTIAVSIVLARLDRANNILT